MSGSLATIILLILFCALLVAGAVQDLISLRISNRISVAVLVVAVAALVLNPGASWWEHPLSFAVTLCFGIVLFILRWLGGGDAKLMAAAAMAFDIGGLIRFIPTVLILGGVLALLFLVVRMVFGNRGPARDRHSLPYGVAIAAGAIAAVLLFPDLTVFA